MKKRLQIDLSVRADMSEYLIRSLESHMMREEVEPFNTVDMHRRDILIDNVLYGNMLVKYKLLCKIWKTVVKQMLLDILIKMTYYFFHI